MNSESQVCTRGLSKVITIFDQACPNDQPSSAQFTPVRKFVTQDWQGEFGYARLRRGGKSHTIACCVLDDGTTITPRYWSKRQPDVMDPNEVDSTTWVMSGNAHEIAMSDGLPWAVFPLPKATRRRVTAKAPRRSTTPNPSWRRLPDDLFHFPR